MTTLLFNVAAKRELPKPMPKVMPKDLWAMLDEAVANPPQPYQPILWSKTPLYRALGKKITDPVVRKQLRTILGNYLKSHVVKVNVGATDLNAALCWDDSPHGHEFWKAAHIKWTPDGMFD